MYELNLPPFEFRLKKEKEQIFIYDDIRKKYVVLTPEEWVRQHIVHFLISHKHYPATLMNVEVGMNIRSMTRRADIVCYDSQANVLLIVECKAPEVKITQNVFEQIAQYNMSLKSKYLLVSNGLQHYSCSIDHTAKTFQFLQDIPDYTSIITSTK